ncbi:MAG: hypothetical protein P8M34_16200 [Saprospiraceae bacterium]|nr:hypothetical protein [Saprospiraceae bacterium]
MQYLKNKWTIITAAFIVVVIIYGRTYSFEYVLDDKIVFTENSQVQKGWNGIGEILTTESFSGYFGSQQDILPGARYRPLSLVTFAIENALWGTDSKWSHLINVLLYFFCVLTLYRSILLLLNDNASVNKVWIAGLSAFIFLILPVHIEAVANVKGRDEIMVLGFSLLALIYILKYVRLSKPKYSVASSLLFFLALLSKENALTFLAVIPLSVFLFTKISLKEWGVVIASLALPTIIYFTMRYNAVGYILGNAAPTNIMNNPFVNMNGSEKSATISHTLLMYLKLSIFPYPLTHDYYPYHIPIMKWNQITPVLSAALHIVMFVVAILSRKKWRIITWSVLTYLLTMTIVSNAFVGVGTFMNERFLFVSSIASSVLVAYGLLSVYKRDNRKLRYLGVILFAFITIGYVSIGLQRVPDWENGFTLNASAVKVSKNSARANLFMGTTYFDQYQSSRESAQKQENLNQANHFISKSFEILPQYQNASKMKAGVAAELFKYDNDLNSLLNTFFNVARVTPGTGFLHEYLRYLNDTPSYSSELINFYYRIGHDEMFMAQKRNEWAARFLLYASKLDENDQKTNLALSKVYNALNRPQETQYYLQKAQNVSNQ